MEDPRFHTREYYQSVGSMFQQMVPMFEQAAHDLLQQIHQEHTGADGQLTEEGRKQAAEVFAVMDAVKARVEEVQQKASTAPPETGKEASVGSSDPFGMKALEEWLEIMFQDEDDERKKFDDFDDFDDLAAAFDKIVADLGDMRNRLSHMEPSSAKDKSATGRQVASVGAFVDEEI